MKQIKYDLSNGPVNVSIEIEFPCQDMVLKEWQKICEELSEHKITHELVSQVEQQIAEWVISQISVTSDFEVK